MTTKKTLILVALAFLVVSASWYFSAFHVKQLTSELLRGDLSKVVVEVDTSSKIMQELLRVPDDSEATKESNSLDENIKGF